MEKKQNGMVKVTYSFGEFLINLIKLQFFWLFGTLKGGLIFGLFPATATVIQAFFLLFEKNELPPRLFPWFNQQFNRNFKQTNILGYIESAVLAVLWIDVRVTGQLLKNQVAHLALLLFFVFALLVGLFLFPAFLRYELKTFNYFKQSFFIVISSFVETLAMVIGIVLVTALSTFFPVLILVALIPLFLFPISWFSLQAMRKIEKNNLAQSKE